MSVKTTCIGAWPKPAYLTSGNWSEAEDTTEESARSFVYTNDAASSIREEVLHRATGEAVCDQLYCGVDVPTDGEQRRENYIHYHCRNIGGIDFSVLTEKIHRNGAAIAPLPTVTGKIQPCETHFLYKDYYSAKSFTDGPVKITVPGPLTIIDTTANTYYSNERDLAFDIADALNHEIRHLASVGCTHIQVDEPLFARKVEDALSWGVECLDRCFDGIPNTVTRVMHMCCGYPGHVDDEDYLKADHSSYDRLARAVDLSCIDQVSIEDAHCLNNLVLLEKFRQTTVILGVIAVAKSRAESVEEIYNRLQIACRHIDQSRLVAAPDCGLVMLDRELAMIKLSRMCEAATLL